MRLRFILILSILSFFSLHSVAKPSSTHLILPIDDHYNLHDFYTKIDSINNDTITNHPLADSLVTVDSLNISKDAIESPIHYESEDSIYFDIKKKKVYLYHKSKIDYDNISINSYYINVDFSSKTLDAVGLKDSLGKWEDKPNFNNDGQDFTSERMSYNFDTKIGRSNNVITKEGEGYLHGEVIKRLADKTINIKSGKYTTCELEQPHFHLELNKARVMPNDKIVSGPAYLVVEEVPLPLVLPFGFFPNKKGMKSGIVVPSYGEGSNNRGFYFEDGGYYWGISNKMDLLLIGDIYTRGSWAVKPRFRYANKYRYNGELKFSYAVNKIGEEDTPEYQKNKDYSIMWSHKQDPKARPNSTFGASVDIKSGNFNKYNPVNTNNYLSNTFHSSISYQTNIRNKLYISLNASHQQNTMDRTFILTLPQLTLSAERFYPLRKKNKTGKLSWYDNINVGYELNAMNKLNTYDSLLTFDNEMFDKFNNGVQQRITIQSPIKLLKYFTWTNSINFTEKWYGKRHIQYMGYELNDKDSLVYRKHYIAENGFKALHEYSFNSSISTQLYGMYSFNKGFVKAIRHVLTPTVGFNYNPDFSKKHYGYYDHYYNIETSKDVLYSLYSKGVYGSPNSRKSGLINFSLNNNLEMKLNKKNDTINEYKKIKLIDNLNLKASYNMMADSLNWSSLNINGRTKLFDRLDVRYAAKYDPYQLNDKGERINKFVWEDNNKLFRKDNASWTFTLNYQISQKDIKRWKYGEKAAEAEKEKLDYVKWDKNWSLNIDYTLNLINKYERNFFKYNRNIIQTININGSINVTDKWFLKARTGYDIENKAISFTDLRITRDLHCWQMEFNWVPLGGYKHWNFTIRVKSSVLQDLKYERRKDFRDYD